MTVTSEERHLHKILNRLHDTPRTHGYSPKGQRCFGLKNGGAKGRTNVIGALLGTTLFAIGLFDININSDVFYSWVTQVLIPVLPKNRALLNK
ncbi:transposase [Symbiopectobacterium sp. RP]|uniref:transposase n=1 Tax=Symbiopectobacterium sp. RP TaxID=3248553 RepID=UPI003D2654D4